MKKFLLLLVLLCSAVAARAQLSTTAVVNPICQGTATPVLVGFIDPTTLYQPGNLFTVELSDASGLFAAPVVIGSVASVSGSGSIAAVIPASAAAGMGYRIRVVASDPAVTGTDNGTDITVVAVPVAPTASSNSPVCAGQTLQLNASLIAGATYSWVGPGITPAIQNQQNPSRPNATVAMGGSYSVFVSLNGCTSQVGVTHVDILPAPAAPVLSSNSPVCAGTQLGLSAQGIPGAAFNWTQPNGQSYTGQTVVIPSAPNSANGTWTCTQTINGCTSAPGSVQVTVNPTPATPTVFTNSPVCEGQTLTLSSTLVPGATYTWIAANGAAHLGNVLAITNTLPTDSGQYTLWTSLNGCVSEATNVNAIVAPEPPMPPIFTNAQVCGGQTLMLSTLPVTGATFNWVGPNGVIPVSGPVVSLPNTGPLNSGTYQLSVASGFGCISDTSSVQVLVELDPGFSYSSGSYCVFSGATPLPVMASSGAGSFVAAPAGLLIDNTTGQITVSGSVIGSYEITHSLGNCLASQTVHIVNSATADFSYPQTEYCQAAPNPAPVFATGATMGVFAVSPAGVVINANSGVIDLSASQPGSYQIINTLLPSSGCSPASDTAFVTILQTPIAPTATSNSPVCTGNTVTFSATAAPGNTFSWSGPHAALPVTGGATLDLPNMQPQNSGAYMVSAISPVGCASAPAVLQVAVSSGDPLIIFGTDTLIAGQTLYLYTSPADTYTWTGPSNFSAVGSAVYLQQITTAQAGYYTATSGQACLPSDSVLVVVGPANYLSGVVFNDLNNNGIQDAGDTPRANQIVRLAPIWAYAYTNNSGAYTFPVATGNFSVYLQGQNPYLSVSPTQQAVSFTGLGGQSAGNNFAVYAPPVTDLVATILPGWPTFVPGFNGQFTLKVYNAGTIPASGVAQTVLPAGLTFVSASPGYTISGDTLFWSFTNLLPGQQNSYLVTMHTSVGTALGTLIYLQGSVQPDATDVLPINNNAGVYWPVVGSFDPNDKAVSPPGPITPVQVAAAQELTYKIRFQNTGTYYAFNILVADTLGELLDVSTFRLLGTSHTCNTTLRENGILEFHFPNIMLPDSNMNEPLSHGYIQYSIKPKTTLQLGDEITNTAHIFFDFNEAIVTNTTSTIVALPNGIAEAKEEQLLHVYPNPNNGNSMLKFTAANRAETTVTLLNLLGQEVWQLKQITEAGEVEIPVDLQQQPAGIYLVRVVQNGKVYSAKLVRQ